MANRQRGFSHTLPKNFTFPSLCTEEEEPTTPHRASIHLDVPPPPPRPASCRSRRFRVRSGTDVSALADSDFRATWNQTSSDVPVPSIEFPSQHDQDSSCAPDESNNNDEDDGYLAPPRGRTALKTPPAQIRATPVDLDPTSSWPTWDHQLAGSGEPIERPGSACSHASDSSISSIDTLASRPSVEGSCTSTESDSHDPFFFGLELPKKPALEAAPFLAPTDEAKARRRQDGARHKWSMAMDTHLWNTYQMYIQDPTITPFKMTPGSVPPLGVTHRVAREAKRRWNCRASGARKSQQAGGDDSATPTPKKVSAAKKLGWSKSESSTRRRLKLLCREKFSIAPHYQRLMMSKTPEPLTSSPEESAEEAHGAAGGSMAFTTRDLGVSLVSSTAPQPLAQLAADTTSFSTENAASSSQVNPIVARRSLGLDRHGFAPRLGSPFNYHTWGPDRSKRRTRRHSPMGRRETIHVTGGFRLQSPPQMDLFSSINNNSNNQTPQQQQVQEPFAEPLPTSEPEQNTCSQLEKLSSQDKTADMGHRRVRIRNRGATTSAVNTRAVQQLFSPPSSTSKNETSPQEKRASKHRRNLSGETIKRLGSPFKMDAPKRPQSSSFAASRTIRHKPSFSDPFISPASGMKPHLSASQSQLQVPGAGAPYDIMEPGLSDAERIRRQIMNMSHSRR